MLFGNCFSIGCIRRFGLLTAQFLLTAPLAYGQFTDVAAEPPLVALWELDEAAGSGTVLDINSTFTGTVSGGTTLGVPGAMTTLGTAAHFNGSNGKIDIPYAAALNPTSYTVEAWAQVQGGAGSYRSPVTSRRSSPQQGYTLYAASNNNWEYWAGTGSTWSSAPSGPSVILNQWVHLAATYDNGSNAKILYLNGHPVSTATASLTPNTGLPMRIGAGGTEGSGNYWFHGAVDNVAVLNQAMAHQSVANHYNAKSLYANQVAVDGPAAYWRLGEQAGTSAYNAMDVTAHTGTYSNVALRQMDTPISNDIDTAASFTHGSARVAVPYSSELNPAGSFTVEAWARADGGQNSYRSVITSRNTAGGSHGFILYANNNNRWSFWNGAGASTDWHKIDGPQVALGEWVHLVGTYNAATQVNSFYVDGMLVGSASGVNYVPNTANDWFIGMGGNGGTEFPFNGLIDEVAVFGQALTAGAVQRHYLVANTGAEVIRWDGGGTGMLWSTPDNWDPAGSPAGKIVVFDNTGSSGTAGAATNTVDANTTVASILFENTVGSHHTTAINSANTLTLEAASGEPRIFVAEAARIDGRLGSSQGFAKTGAGVLALGGGGSPMGIGGSGVTVSEGTLRLARTGLGFDAGVFTPATTLTVEAGGTLEIGADWNLKYSNVVSVDGGTLRFTAGGAADSNNYVNNLILNNASVVGNTMRLGYLSDALFTVTGTSTISAPMQLVRGDDYRLVIDVSGGAALNVTSTIADRAGHAGARVVKDGPGTLRLDGALNYTGETIVDGGMLILNRNGTLAAGNTGQFGSSGRTVTVNSGATLRVGGQWTMGDGGQHHLVANGGTIDFRGGENYHNRITLTGGAVTTADSGRPWRTGHMGGDALITVNPSSVSSTISGLLYFVRSGSVEKTAFDVADGPAEYDLIVSAAIHDHPPASTYGGMVLAKDGPGTMVLSGASTFIGGVDVNAGTLLVNNTSGSGTGTGTVTVHAGATLGGTGTIAGQVTGAGRVSPGTSAGILTVGSIDPSAGLGAVFEFGQTGSPVYDNAAESVNDVLRVTGASPITGPLTSANVIDVYFGLGVDIGDVFRGGVYVDVAGDPQGLADFYAAIENATYNYYVLDGGRYVGLSDYHPLFDVALSTVADPAAFGGGSPILGGVMQFTVVPEPGTWTLLLAAVAGALLVRRRRVG